MNIQLKGTRNGFILTGDNKEAVFNNEFKEKVDIVLKKMEKLITGSNIFIHPECLQKEKCFKKLSKHLIKNFKINKVERYKEVVEKSNSKQNLVPDINENAETRIYSGRVRSGQQIYSKNHIVIIGDVNPGGVVVAGGDIIILGSLLGNAIAGQSGNSESIIVALDFRPVQIQISKVIAAGISGLKNSNCEYASVENGAIVVLDYQKEKPFSKLPMLVER